MTEGPADDPEEAPALEEDRRVSWAELFFDLVFVVAVTRTSQLILDDSTPHGVLRALVVFVPVYWMWIGMAIQTNQQGTERAWQRIRLFAVALAAVFMAIALPAAYDDRGLLFAVAYWVGRIAIGAPVVVARRSLDTPYAVSMVLSAPVLVVGSLLDDPWRVTLWAVVAVVELATPALFNTLLSRLHYHAGHLVERFGLFVLIALGESVVAVASSSPEAVTVRVGFAVAAAFVLPAALWWLYFQYASDAMRFAVRTARVQAQIVRRVLSYGHLAFLGSIIVVSVGLHGAIHDPGGRLSGTVAGLLYGGVAAYCASFGFTRWMMFRLVSWTRLAAAGAVLVLLPLALHLTTLAALVLLAVVIVAVNVVEWYRVEILAPRAEARAAAAEPDEA